MFFQYEYLNARELLKTNLQGLNLKFLFLIKLLELTYKGQYELKYIVIIEHKHKCRNLRLNDKKDWDSIEVKPILV